LLFRRDQVDEVDDWASRVGNISRNSILWIDLDSLDPERIGHLVEALGLEDETQGRLEDGVDRPFFGEVGSYVHVVAFAPSQDSDVTDARKGQLPGRALTRPEIDAVTSSKHTERFRELQSRLDEVVQPARDSRDSVAGSLDVLVARPGQHTNEIMRS